MDTSSINPVSVIDEAIDLSTRLAGTEFPISIFPTQIQRIIHEVHECHNYPTDYIAAAILTAMAVGIGNTHLAQIKQGWVESPILYYWCPVKLFNEFSLYKFTGQPMS